MDKIFFLIGIIVVLVAGMSMYQKEINRIAYNNRIFIARINELKEIITEKDITYNARIEELLYIKNKFY